jgi:hypothetical protein
VFVKTIIEKNEQKYMASRLNRSSGAGVIPKSCRKLSPSAVNINQKTVIDKENQPIVAPTHTKFTRTSRNFLHKSKTILSQLKPSNADSEDEFDGCLKPNSHFKLKLQKESHLSSITTKLV